MTNEEYITKVLRTESPSFSRVNKRLLHSCLGVADEGGEYAKAIKRSLFYDRPLDVANVKEELGDLLWYIALAVDELGTTFEELMDLNIAKLMKRYPEQFTAELAEKRNLLKEREALEK